MNNTTRKGLGRILMIAMVITICYSSNNVIADIGVTVSEKEMVSLRTISILPETTETTGSAIMPNSMNAVKEERKEEVNIITAIEETPLKMIKKKDLTLKKARKTFSKKMDLSKPSKISKKEFVKLIHKMNCDYTGLFKKNCKYIWTIAKKNHVDVIFLTAICANESGWGADEAAIANNNYTGQKIEGRLISYTSERECLRKTAKNLSKNYLRKGGKYYEGMTLYDVNKNYCEPGVRKDGTTYTYQWADEVYGCMKRILWPR